MKKLNFLIGVLYLNMVGLVIAATYLVLDVLSVTNEVNIGEKSFDNVGYAFSILFCVWLLIYALFVSINIISLIINYKQKKFYLIYQKMKRVKIALIPYWIINFICYLPISVFLLLVGHGFGFIIVPIFIFASYIVLVVTSAFSIAYLLFLRTSNKINNKKFIIHVVLQLLFVVDIVDTFRIIKKYNYNMIQEGNIHKTNC